MSQTKPTTTTPSTSPGHTHHFSSSQLLNLTGFLQLVDVVFFFFCMHACMYKQAANIQPCSPSFFFFQKVHAVFPCIHIRFDSLQDLCFLICKALFVADELPSHLVTLCCLATSFFYASHFVVSLCNHPKPSSVLHPRLSICATHLCCFTTVTEAHILIATR